MESFDIRRIEDTWGSGVYVKRPLTIVRGEGALLYDDQGNEYVDCIGGQGAANLGHAHPKVAAAIARQASQLIHLPEMFYNDQRAALLQRLMAIVPPGINRVFLCNSGTEAVEGAIKFARFSTGRTGIIAAMRGFHGRTLGALSATWNPKYRQPFTPLLPDVSHVPYNNLEKLAEAVNDTTAAVMLEVVQGEGGIYPGTVEYLLGAQALCRERGALLILDEVQTGFGRTGRMFALSHYDLSPDLVAVAKSMGGGMPVGAVLIGERVAPLTPGIHGSTFGGNPLASAAACAALDVLVEEDLPGRAAEMGAYLQAGIRALELPVVREVRGLGLMVGVELKQKVAPYITALMEHGVLAFPAGLTVIRLLPPLVITREQVDRVIEALRIVLSMNLNGEGGDR